MRISGIGWFLLVLGGLEEEEEGWRDQSLEELRACLEERVSLEAELLVWSTRCSVGRRR